MKKFTLLSIFTIWALCVFPSFSQAQTIAQAVQNNDTATLNQLISSGANVNQADSNGNTPLMLASSFGDTIITNILINAGAVVDATNNSGATAQIIASQDCYTNVVAILLSAGADPTIQDMNRMRGYDYVVEANPTVIASETPRNSGVSKKKTFQLLFTALGY